MPASADPARPALEPLAERVGHRFANLDLLALALTHRSWCAEHGGAESNERLEFLGDAVLGMAVTDHIYRTCPGLAEGAMAKVRAAVVSAPALAAVAVHLGIGEGLRLGKGEEASGGRAKPSILADALEAVLGAVYLDASWPEAQRVVLDLFAGLVEEAATDPGTQDYKTRLQELVARRFDRPPCYLVEEEGPDHDKLFRARVLVGGAELGVGEGRSKKQAQQAAAQVAWAAVAEGAAAGRARAGGAAEVGGTTVADDEAADAPEADAPGAGQAVADQ